MRKITTYATMTFGSAKDPDNSIIMRTRGYGDPDMKKYLGLDTTDLVTGNFNHVDYMLLRPDGSTEWGAVGNKCQFMSESDWEYLRSIQPDDFYIYGYNVDQKMNWLGLVDVTDGSKPKRPWWIKNGEHRRGTSIVGHSRVRIKANQDGTPRIYNVVTSMPGDSRKISREFCEVDPFRRGMMGWGPVEWLLDQGYIQQWTQANKKPVENTIVDTVRGVIYDPVWSFEDWQPAQTGIYLIWRGALYQ